MGSTIFSGSKVKTLKDELQILNGASIINLSADPTITAYSAKAGSIGIYNGRQYKKLDDGSTTNWIEIVSTGGINYISNWKSIYAGYNDAAAEPVDGTGGTLNNLSLSLSTTNALDGVSDLKISKAAANAQGEGVSFDFKVTTRALGNMHTIKFVYYMSNANLPDNTFTVWLYKKDAPARQLQPVPFKLQTTTVPSTFQAQIQLDYDSVLSNVDDWRLEIHCASTNTTACDVFISDLEFTPTQYSRGAFVSGWKSFTPTGSWTTNTTYYGAYRRVGDSIDIYYRWNMSGQPNATNLILNMPNNLEMDFSKLNLQVDADSALGYGNYTDAGTSVYIISATRLSNSSFRIHYLRNLSDKIISHWTVTHNDPFVPGSGDFGQIYIRGIPVKGWGETQILSDESDTRQVIASAYNSSSGSYSPTVPFNFSTIVKDTHNCITTGANWRFTAKIPGEYIVLVNDNSRTGEHNSAILYKNGAYNQTLFSYTTGGHAFSGVAYVNLKAGDYIDLRPDGAITAIPGRITIFKLSGSTQIAASEKEYFRIQKGSSAQTISSSTLTPVTFQDIREQSHAGSWDAANNRYIFQKSGTYVVSFYARTYINHAAGTHITYILVLNGNSIATNVRFYRGGSYHEEYTAAAQSVITVKAGDILQLIAACTASIPFQIDNSVWTSLSIYSQGGT